uniref:Golgi SNAP receptor complex member 1-1-like n=1 Tax=Tanacetum cinerariifolium TaxID=118510 RepID=A0A6L2JUR8_TANCI|nr:Golgi SNAP receptor complex member 1-1-like [Tanacetum cinerariifolium]
MQAWVSSGGSEMFSHTLNRHHEIHHDLTQEFNRLRSSLKAKREHASLLEDFREFDRARLDIEEGCGSHEQSLLKERATIMRNTGQMDGVISQAQDTLGSLVFQRSTFRGVNSKLSNVSSRLPTVNSIISAINKKKSMDTIILSLLACLHVVRLSENTRLDSREWNMVSSELFESPITLHFMWFMMQIIARLNWKLAAVVGLHHFTAGLLHSTY